MLETVDTHDGTMLHFNDDIGQCLLRNVDTGCTRLWSIMIDETQRNKGFAQQMISEIIDYCKELNIPMLWLQVYTDNDIAIHVYKKAGFVITKDNRFCGDDVHEMELVL